MFDYVESETTVCLHVVEANATIIVVIMFPIYSNRAVTFGAYILVY